MGDVSWELFKERKTKGDYKRFSDSLVKSFIDSFKTSLPYNETKVTRKRRWRVREHEIQKVKNILQKCIEEEIIKEDLKILSEETEEKMQELKVKVDEAKDDLKYIRDEVHKKMQEEF